MNYRHAFHAGNFADVMKHALLSRIILHLRQKPAPFRIIDTHAGEGLYDLHGEAAGRTGEWQEGIARLLAPECPLSAEVASLLAPYLDIVRALPAGRYPGSPLIAAGLMRRGDRLLCSEIVPATARRLAAALPRQAKVVTLDGYAALNAFVPPPERRGIVLVDPPFEQAREFDQLVDALAGAHRKWATGIYAAWYPVKTPTAGSLFAAALAAAGIPRMLRLELWVDRPAPDLRLAGTGLIVINPPYTLEGEARLLLPALAGSLARVPAEAGWRVEPRGVL